MHALYRARDAAELALTLVDIAQMAEIAAIVAGGSKNYALGTLTASLDVEVLQAAITSLNSWSVPDVDPFVPPDIDEELLALMAAPAFSVTEPSIWKALNGDTEAIFKASLLKLEAMEVADTARWPEPIDADWFLRLSHDFLAQYGVTTPTVSTSVGGHLDFDPELMIGMSTAKVPEALSDTFTLTLYVQRVNEAVRERG